MKRRFKKILIEFIVHLFAWVVVSIMFTVGDYRSNVSFWRSFMDFVGRFTPTLLIFMLFVYTHYYFIFSRLIPGKRYGIYFFRLTGLIVVALLLDNIHHFLFFLNNLNEFSWHDFFNSALRVFLVYLPYAILYAFIKGYTQSQKEKSELIIDKLISDRRQAELQKQATELEMQALRAQMNPHFIFNSLNSINRFILQNNKALASEYLTKFSRLVRLILQNSQTAFIALESEIESLQLYLELEAVRFDHHFEFKVTVEDDLDTDIIKIPPLIIQPYAENAIWHGLMHKEEKGNLEIELFRQEDLLYCRITDDGIGRAKAAQLKSKSASAHKSMAMQITASRIEMLQQKNNLDVQIKITDLILPDGAAGGTEVILKIPVHYD